ncbi:hypothetical protein AO385_0685 [Moraxella catarrhalis]|uniref:Uncharacterized protein n=1 Tax=Moraxella catarrhalis TaxID=480 RepID=A0A198UE70_MORCA|nr:hypothetical protein MCRH_0982 [Moraxella catarrhalis RH4]OAU94342.1 hypothetical protein AO383_2248 [Moraxella catarrhalis]OAU94690.1 hypothetical protein AO384_2047 [Moraxella catarrhalis]OAV03071.1 hypothetical protein AO385_0685 [Moraxella catarrhalis]OAV27105.1 hypothetical protein AO369_1020 [Moraxella catarrhalis]
MSESVIFCSFKKTYHTEHTNPSSISKNIQNNANKRNIFLA